MLDPFDDQIRAVLGNATDKVSDARSILSELTPAFHRARRVAQIKAAVTGLAVVLVASGAATAVHTTTDREPTNVIASSPMESTIVTSISPSIATSQSSVPTTTARPDRVATSSAQQSPTTTSATVPSSTTSIPGSSTTSSTNTTQPQASTTTGTETTSIESSCGSIRVSTSGATITLVGVIANAGYAIDQKDDGPETVEVSFEGPSGHCEIKAEVRNGALWTDVSTE